MSDAISMTELELAMRKLANQVKLDTIEACANVVGNIRQSEAGIFDPKHSGQRGCDRSDAIYDAYQAIRALAHPSQDGVSP